MGDRASTRRWAITLLGIGLVVGHVLALRHAWSKAALPTAVIAGLGLVVVAKHLGIATVLVARWRRRPPL